MTIYNNTTLSNNLVTQNAGNSSSTPFITEFQPRDPTSADINYPIQKRWINTTNGNEWILLSFISIAEVTTANWLQISSQSSQVETLTGDDSVIINPNGSNNISILGSVVANSTHTKALFTENSAASTMEIDLQVASAIASTNITKVGLASFNNTQFAVDGNGFVTLSGGTQAIDSIGVDAATGPGTNPVLPTVAGLVTMTGAQVAAGVVGANVIRTNSVAANTWSAEIQRSTAVASTASINNGVAHFNSATSSVDANGFMSPFQYAKWVVNPTAGLGTHQTISAAIAAASSGDYILVTQGIYTENPTVTAGLTISGMPNAGDTPCVTINGTVTMTAAGISTIANVNLKTNSAFAVVVSGSNACQLILDTVNIQCSNNTGLSFTNSNAASEIDIYNSSGDLETTGIAYYSMSSIGLLYLNNIDFQNSGNSVTASNNSAGAVSFAQSNFVGAISTSGTGSVLSINTVFATNTVTSTWTINGTPTQSTLFNSVIENPQNVATISIGATASVAVCNSTIATGNANWVTGTGTIGYGSVVCPLGGAIAGTLTANAIFNFVGTVKP